MFWPYICGIILAAYALHYFLRHRQQQRRQRALSTPNYRPVLTPSPMRKGGINDGPPPPRPEFPMRSKNGLVVEPIPGIQSAYTFRLDR